MSIEQRNAAFIEIWDVTAWHFEYERHRFACYVVLTILCILFSTYFTYFVTSTNNRSERGSVNGMRTENSPRFFWDRHTSPCQRIVRGFLVLQDGECSIPEWSARYLRSFVLWLALAKPVSQRSVLTPLRWRVINLGLYQTGWAAKYRLMIEVYVAW